MHGYTIKLAGGRAVEIRPCTEGAGVQLSILSVRGNPLAWVNLDATELPGVVGSLKRAQHDADHDLMAALKRRQVEATERQREAWARNPWFKPGRRKRGLR